jgi:hypothetical protein
LADYCLKKLNVAKAHSAHIRVQQFDIASIAQSKIGDPGIQHAVELVDGAHGAARS